MGGQIGIRIRVRVRVRIRVRVRARATVRAGATVRVKFRVVKALSYDTKRKTDFKYYAHQLIR